MEEVGRHFKRVEPEGDVIDVHFVCNYCKRELHTVHSSNLKKHLRRHHPEALSADPLNFNEETETEKQDSVVFDNENDTPYYVENRNSAKRRKLNPNRVTQTSNTWKYFKKTSKNTARCLLCLLDFKFGWSSVSNLTRHLRRQHSIDPSPHIVTGTDFSDTLPGTAKDFVEDFNDDDTTEPAEEGSENQEYVEMLQFYERTAQGQYQCIMCQPKVYITNRSNLRDHIKDHSDLVALSEEDAEDDSNLLEEFAKIKMRKKVPTKERRSTTQHAIKSERTEEVLNDPASKIEEKTELDSFLQYAKVLLKKFPEDHLEKVQVDIINLIMNAKNNLKNSLSVTSTDVTDQSQSFKVIEIHPEGFQE